MAYYAGETLRERLARGTLDPSELLDVGIRVGEGVAAAHEAGIVHRDLKPANVMLGGGRRREGARLRHRQAGGRASDLTATSVRIGTVAYMSPEQARGEPVDHTVPISGHWGVTLFQCATGEHPFGAPTDLATLDRVLRTDPPPLDAGPPGLDPVLRRALEKDPTERHANMAELVADLRALARGESTVAATAAGTIGTGPAAGSKAPEVRGRLPGRWLLAAVTAAVIIGGSAVIGRSGAPPEDAESDSTLGAVPGARAGRAPDPVLAIPQGTGHCRRPLRERGPDA